MPGVLDQILGGLQYAGDSLDKLGGRPLRGVLGGRPREALSFVPFSDELGLTDPNQIVRGRDLTDQWGVTRSGDTHWTSHAAGMAADALVDPWLILGGAAKAAPKLASRWNLLGNAGTVDRMMARQAGQRGAIRWPAKKVPYEGDFYKPAADIEKILGKDTPLADLHRLADSVNVDVSPYPHNPRAYSSNLNAMGEMAHYDTTHRTIVPNLTAMGPGGMGVWEDWQKMADLSEKAYASRDSAHYSPQFSSLHEIGHALHHNNLNPGDPDALMKATGHLPGVSTKILDEEQALKEWLSSLYPGLVKTSVSDYAATAPWEFIAEQFGKHAIQAPHLTQALIPRALQNAYGAMRGPEVPEKLLAALHSGFQGFSNIPKIGL